MFKFLSKLIPTLIFWGIFIFVVFKIPYPESLTQANIVQVLSFFIPLFLALTVTLNYFLKNIISSTFVCLGLIFLSLLKALDSLNIVTGLLTAIAIALLFSYFRKVKRRNLTPIQSGLTKPPKIPKLTRRI